MLIVWKGGASRIKLTNPETIGVIIGVGAAVALVVVAFFLPWLYRRLLKNDWELKWYHVFMGPLLLRRPEVTSVPEDAKIVQNYYQGHKTMQELQAARGTAHSAVKSEDVEDVAGSSKETATNGSQAAGDTPDDLLHPVEAHAKKDGTISPEETPVATIEHVSIIGLRPAGALFSPAVLFWYFKKFFFRGCRQRHCQLTRKEKHLDWGLRTDACSCGPL